MNQNPMDDQNLKDSNGRLTELHGATRPLIGNDPEEEKS